MLKCKHKKLSNIGKYETEDMIYVYQNCLKCHKIFILDKQDKCKHKFVKVDKVKKQYLPRVQIPVGVHQFECEEIPILEKETLIV